MSANVVDNKAVELQLKNENFEKNAKTSMSTLDRLKNALNFKGVSAKVFDGFKEGAEHTKAGVENLTGAMGSLSSALGTIKDVTAFTMIAKAASDAYDKVEQLIKSVTTDMVSEGWGKYEMMTTSMQTIMSATSDAFDSQEEQLAEVTRQMEKLNWFADETAFNLNDMTSSIGKFTANRIDLDTSVTAIQGIGTWASKSGASAQEASRAMYNLSQAISVGAVKLMDWKSIENANMATAQFKQTAIDTAESLGLLTKAGDDLWKTQAGNEVSATNFNEALKDEWFTSEVLLKSLDKYGSFAVKLNDYATEFNGDFGAANIMDLIDAYKSGEMTAKTWKEASAESGVELERLKEIIKDLSKEEYEFGMSAFRAAQETKTWSEAVEYTQEAVSSGWMNTFQLLFGEYTEAKKLWSDVSEFMYDVFVKDGEKRNELLEEALNGTDAVTLKQWRGLENQGVTSVVFRDALKAVAEESGVAADQLNNLDDAVRNGLITSGMLEDAYAKMMAPPQAANQDLIDQIEGISKEDEAVKAFLDTLDGYDEEALKQITFGDHKYAEGYEDLEKGLDNIIRSMGLTQDEGEEVKKALQGMGYFGGLAEDALAGYTDEQLRSLGMTEKQIEEFHKVRDAGGDLSEAFEKAGIDTTTGTEHWVNGLHNLMDTIVQFKELIGSAWSEFFPELEASSITSFLKAFDEGSESLLNYVTAAYEAEDGSNTLRNVLEGAMSIIDLVVSNLRILGEGLMYKGILMAAGAVMKFVTGFVKMSGIMMAGASLFNFFKGIIEGLGIDFGSLANGIAKLTQKFAAWFKAVNPINKALDFMRAKGQAVGRSIREWVDELVAMPRVMTGIRKLQGGFKIFTEGFSGHMEDGKKRLAAFEEEVERMGGLKPENMGKIFKMGADELLDWVKTFPGVKTMLEAIGDIWSGIREKLIAAGIPVDKIEEKFKKLWETVKKGANFAVTNFRKLEESFKKFEAWFLKLPVVNSAITRFGGAFDKVRKSFEPFAKGMPKQWQNFMNRVGQINEGGFKLKNVGEIFKAFKEEILSYIANWDGFKAIKDAFTGFFKDIFKSISENKTAMTIFNSLKDFFNTIREIASVVELPKSFDDIPRFLEDLKKAISGIPSSGEGSGLGGAIFDGAKWLLEKIIDLVSFAVSHWKLVLGIALVVFLFKKLSGLFKDIHEYFNAMTKELKARAFLETAAGVVLLAVAIWIVVNTFKDLIELFGKGDFASNMLHIAPGLIAITVIMLLVTGLFKTVGKMEVKAGTTWGVAAAVAAVWVLAKALIDLTKEIGVGGMAGIKKILPAIVALGVIMLALKSLFKSISSVDTKPGAVWGVAASLAALWVVSQAFKDLSKLSWGQIGKGIVALGAVILGIIALMSVASATKVDEGVMYSIAAVIAIMALALGGMAYIASTDPEALKLAIAALVGVMLSMAVLAGVVGGLKPKLSAMGALIVVIGVIATAIGLLNHFVGVEATVAIADSLTKLFAAIAILMVAIAVVGKIGLPAVGVGLLALIAVLVVLTAAMAGIGALVNKFGLSDEIATGIETVRSVMDTVCNAITGIIQAIGKGLFGDRTPLQMLMDDIAYMVETIASDTFKANVNKIGELNLLSSSGVNIALVAVMAKIFGTEGAIMSIFNLISEVTIGKTAIESLVDDIAYLAETIGGSKFAADMANIGRLNMADASWNLAELGGITAIFGAEGAIMSIFNLISEMSTDKTAIESVIDDVSYMASTLGSSKFAADIANIGRLNASDATVNLLDIAGITAIFGVGGALSTIADSIIGFATGDKDYDSMTEAMEDVSVMANVLGDDTFVENIKTIGEMNMLEAFANLVDVATITGIFGVGGALSTIADSIIGFATGDKDYDSMTEAMEDVKTMADTLGGQEFQDNMQALADTTIPSEKIDTLIELLEKLNMQGLVSAVQGLITKWLTDDETTALGKWASDVEQLGEAIKTWNTKMNEAGELIVDEAAITALTDAVAAITKTGGLAGVIEEFVKGTVDTEEFERRVGSLGTAIGNFNTNMGEVDANNLSSAARVLTSLTTIASKFSDFSLMLDNADNAEIAFGHVTGSINTMVNGIDDPEAAAKVGQSAASISTAMSVFAQIKLDGDIVNTSLAEKFKNNVQTIIDAIENTVNVDTSGIDKLESGVNRLNSVNLPDPAAKANLMLKNEAKEAGNAGGEAADSYSKSLADGSGEVSSAAGSLAGAAASAFSDVSRFYQAGLNIAGAIAGGIYSASSMVVDAVSSVMSSAASGAKIGDMWYVGYNFVKGFADGITLYTYVATKAAELMATSAKNTVNAVIGAHSPARETIKSGKYFGQGLMIGILGEVRNVEGAAADLGIAAKNGLNGAIGSINSIISSNLDDGPVIRPVLDLSEIQNGAKSIGDMLNFGEPISVSTNLNAISTTMRNRDATSNGDLLYALDSLQRAVESNPGSGDTFIVDGVTYDDGSNITDAVRTLVGATIVQRRS